MNLIAHTARKESGFSLVEMAIVLMILGVVLSGLLGAMGQSAENTRRLEAKNTLREIEESLYAFAQVHGRLPCPSDADTNGIEDITDPLTGTCDKYHGLVPNATLGLSGSMDGNGFLQDPWGNAYRYSVISATQGGFRYTGTNSIQSIYNDANNQVADDSPNTIRVCDNTACSAAIMTNVAPAVVLSMGSNWGGVATGSAEEQANGNGATLGTEYSVTNTNTFVLAGYSEENFDDMMVWISPHLLFSKMIAAGKLP